MKYRFFHIPALDSEAAETALNEFCTRNIGFRLARAQSDIGWCRTDRARILSVAVLWPRRQKANGPRYAG